MPKVTSNPVFPNLLVVQLVLLWLQVFPAPTCDNHLLQREVWELRGLLLLMRLLLNLWSRLLLSAGEVICIRVRDRRVLGERVLWGEWNLEGEQNLLFVDLGGEY